MFLTLLVLPRRRCRNFSSKSRPAWRRIASGESKQKSIERCWEAHSALGKQIVELHMKLGTLCQITWSATRVHRSPQQTFLRRHLLRATSQAKPKADPPTHLRHFLSRFFLSHFQRKTWKLISILATAGCLTQILGWKQILIALGIDSVKKERHRGALPFSMRLNFDWLAVF